MIQRNTIDAIILDLDGVITQTASLHERAWRKMFDSFLFEYSEKKHEIVKSFTHEDYQLYVDGKPRFQGADDFLRSRNIVLPFGFPDDPTGFTTVCSLANHKNEYYQELLESEGVFVFPDTREMLTVWKIQGYRLGLFSSSKSCYKVISKAGLREYFDIIVDGNDLTELRLKGKPEPDMLLYAVERLGSTPARSAVIEDASSGIEAGKRGAFCLVIGVIRNGSADLLKKSGADKVVFSLRELRPVYTSKKIGALPLLSQLFSEMFSTLSLHPMVLFLDYDGTLTPIVDRPEQALLSDKIREVLGSLSKKCTVGIISGRNRQELEEMIQLKSVYYAGDHGFDISGPDNVSMIHPMVKIVLPSLDRAEHMISESLGSIQGILIERKKYTIAVHYRMVKEKEKAKIFSELRSVRDCLCDLRITEGKKVIELRPDINWNKGDALLWLIDKTVTDKKNTSYFYFGDDLTDEDAFKAIKDIGTSVLIGDHECLTIADYWLKDVVQLQYVLEEIDSLM